MDLELDKDWCINMAKKETDCEIWAGVSNAVNQFDIALANRVYTDIATNDDTDAHRVIADYRVAVAAPLKAGITQLVQMYDGLHAIITSKDMEIGALKEREALLRNELLQAREVLHHAAYRTTEMKNMVPRIDAILAEETSHG